MILRQVFVVSYLAVVAVGHPSQGAQRVNESARELPIAAEVDVLVVGGSTGAVAAAVEAAGEGATVFLAAPHPYLGDDMTATLRLWLEKGETPATPFEQRVFSDELSAQPEPNRLEFTYEADTDSARVHADSSPPGKLTDGQWSSASQHSVQFDRHCGIVADLKTSQEVRKIRVMVFRRREREDKPGDGFDVQSVRIRAGNDGAHWQDVGVLENDKPFGDLVTLTLPVSVTARYVELAFELPPTYQRMLLGEIEIIGPAKEGAAHAPPPPRPMHVKKVLDDALLKAHVQYLYSCYPTDVLRDALGQPCGIVMANRAGRQAIIAKRIIDASPRAIVARMADIPVRGSATNERTFRRVVIGGTPRKDESMAVREIEPPYRGVYPNTTYAKGGVFPVIEYTFKSRLDNAGYGALMKFDQRARTMTYDPQQQYTSDVLFEIPHDRIQSGSDTRVETKEDIPISVFRPARVEQLFVLSGCADVSREWAARLVRPLALIRFGRKLGKIAAQEAKPLPAPQQPRLSGQVDPQPSAEGDVREMLDGIRPTGQYATVSQHARAIPVLGTYDVVVIGGGTGGAPAGIGAARRGAKTLVIEYLHGLGGVGTEGAIAGYYWGNLVGFTATVLDGDTRWQREEKKEWYRQALLEAGADVWFGTIGCGAFVRDNRLVGAVVATPYGRGVVLANTVIDATGNSDVAAAAGAECIYTDGTEFGMQGTGLPGLKLGGAYNNTDFTIVDETDMVDVWHTFVYSKEKYVGAFDHGRLIDTRERRRIVGDHIISITDQINERTYPDSVVRTWSNFDTHGYTIDPYFLLEHPEKVGIGVYIPFRAMLPKGLEGIIVTGLSISAHRDAVPLIRMQADIQNGGYAAGVAGAMASYAETTVRHVDVRRLQEHLVKIGNIPESVLEDRDSYPLSDESLANAVRRMKDGRGAAVALSDPERAMPMLKDAYASATGQDRLVYAKALATLGVDDGLDTLIAEVRRAEKWDKGWNYRGMGQFGAALSPLDVLIIGLGRAGNKKAVPVILEKVAQLDARSDFSHHRAVGLALELLQDPTAAQPLAELLAKKDISGHVHRDIATAKDRGVSGGTNAERTRRESLRELMLARALFRCGDYRGVGANILAGYIHDLRGHLARHAKAILDEKQ